MRKTQREHGKFRIENEKLKLGHQLCVPEAAEVKEKIMNEAHCTPYAAHSGSTKMFQDLRHSFWWDEMKDVADYVHKCLVSASESGA